MTTWKAIPGFSGYDVSDEGQVRSVNRLITTKAGVVKHSRGRVLQPALSKWGRRIVRLYPEEIPGGRTRPVSVLVLETFTGPRPAPNLECCHNDGDLTNDSAANLRWGTRGSNVRDAVNHGTHNNARKTACKFGHEFTPENTYQRASGRRACRTCGNSRQRAYQQRKRVDHG